MICLNGRKKMVFFSLFDFPLFLHSRCTRYNIYLLFRVTSSSMCVCSMWGGEEETVIRFQQRKNHWLAN